jgi:hypothetical protein
MTYAEFGQTYPRENRIKAAEAAIALLFASYIDHPTASSYVSTGVERLEEFAGEEVWLEVAHRLNIMGIGDEPNREVLEVGIQTLREAFDWKTSPNGHRWWRDVIVWARRDTKERGDSDVL